MPVPDPGGGTTTIPAAISTADVWSLHARPDQLDTAAGQWRVVAEAFKDAADDIDGTAKAVYHGGWEGPAAESFDAHRKKLTVDLDDAEVKAKAVAGVLESAAGSLRTAQSHLTDEWAKVVAVPFTYDAPMHLLFSPAIDDQGKLVTGSIARCAQIRRDLDDRLSDDVVRFERARAAFRQIAATWASVAAGGSDPFTMPAEVALTGVIYDGNHVIVNTGTGDDDVTIRVDPQTGMQIVTVNGTASTTSRPGPTSSSAAARATTPSPSRPARTYTSPWSAARVTTS